MHTTALLIALFSASPGSQALAWWDEGHMQIAYVAYQRLNAPGQRQGRCIAQAECGLLFVDGRRA